MCTHTHFVVFLYVHLITAKIEDVLKFKNAIFAKKKGTKPELRGVCEIDKFGNLCASKSRVYG